jgi:hypothetical protein
MSILTFDSNLTVFNGTGAVDTLLFNTTAADLTSATLNSVEILKAGTTSSTFFVVDQSDLAAHGSVIGNTGTDWLRTNGTVLDLTSTTLSSIEILQSGSGVGTKFVLDQADLAKNGGILGSAGNDALIAHGTSLDLTSTAVLNVEQLIAGTSKATTFTLDATDAFYLKTITGGAGNDTLVVKATDIDLSASTLSSIETLKAGTTAATTFELGSVFFQQNIIGTAKSDTIVFDGAAVDLAGTTLTSIEILKAGTASDTLFAVDQTDLAKGGSIIGGAGTDSVMAAGTSLDLTSTTLTSIEAIRVSSGADTTVKISTSELAGMQSVYGSAGHDTLIVTGTAIDITTVGFSSIEILKAGTAAATTFTVNFSQVGFSGELTGIVGGAGIDTLAASGSLDLSSTTLTSIERLVDKSAGGFNLTVDQADLAKGGSIVGNAGGIDAIYASGTALDLSSTTLTSVEALGADQFKGTLMTITGQQLTGMNEIGGWNGLDTLMVKSSTVDLVGKSLYSLEVVKAGLASATTFKLDVNELSSNHVTTVIGGAGIDTLIVTGANVDLSSLTGLTSIEKLVADPTLGNQSTTFKVTQADLANKGSIVGNAGASADTVTAYSDLDLSSTTLTSIEVIEGHKASGTLLTFGAAQLKGLTIEGFGSLDTLAVRGTLVDLSSTSLSSMEVLTSTASTATTFKVDLADIGFATVIGHAGIDTLTINGTDANLMSTGLSSIEKLNAGSSNAMVFTLDTGDLATLQSISGGQSQDLLKVVNNASDVIDLSNIHLTSIESVQVATLHHHGTFQVGANLGGTTLILESNSTIDTVQFEAGYKAATVTSDATIMAHSLTVSTFGNNDVLDVSALTKGAPATHTDMTAAIQAANPATLKAALNLAATGNGSTTADVVTFQYHGDTYILVDNSAAKTVGADDAVIKLVGTHTLADSNFGF